MGLVIAVVGMPGCGKGELAKVVADAGYPVFSMGDMIRAEVERQGIEGDPHVFGRVAQEMRDEFGYGVLATKLVPEVEKSLSTNPIVLIEGMRGVDEQEVFVQAWQSNFQVVAIEAAVDIRFDRITQRGRAEDGNRDSFDIRDQRESGWGVGKLISSAEHHLTNESGLEEFQNVAKNWLESIFPVH
jgi:dephospho-CoA kinase